jgi:adenosine kinase
VTIAVNGSIAFDTIMTFPDYFKNHILPDKVHLISVSFLLDSLQRRRGGCGGNIAYNLTLLGQRPLLVGSAGRDFGEYREWLEAAGVDTSAVVTFDDEVCATGFVTTDLADNQIWAYYPGTMLRTEQLSMHKLPVSPEAVIISPNDPAVMVRFAGECRELGFPYVFDPGQSIPNISGEDMVGSIRGAMLTIGNDYELEMIRSKTGMAPQDLLELTPLVVVTLGEKGSRLITAGEVVTVPAVKPEVLADPTGAGDAYRAGLVVALLKGCDLRTAGQIAALIGTYAIEQKGTQEHSFNLEQFAARYQDAWGTELPALV